MEGPKHLLLSAREPILLLALLAMQLAEKKTENPLDYEAVVNDNVSHYE